jgi:hypothetical protein
VAGFARETFSVGDYVKHGSVVTENFARWVINGGKTKRFHEGDER